MSYAQGVAAPVAPQRRPTDLKGPEQRPRLRALTGGAGLPADDRWAGPPRLSPDRRLRVLVHAREEIVHWGFRVLLTDQPWIERCVTVVETEKAVELALRYDVDVAILGVGRLDEAAARLSRELSERVPGIRVLFMGCDGRVAGERARAAGAAGVIYRDWSAEDLVTSVRMAGMGVPLFERSAPVGNDLSDREQDIIVLIAEGATNREIGARLYLSPNTVKQNASALYRKLEARNRAEAVRQAQRLGLIA